jgi:hypothetical protein
MVQVVTPISPNALMPDTMVQTDWIDARVLAANTVETFQAPTGAKYVILSGDGAFYAKIAVASTAAAVPAADVTDGTASELIGGSPFKEMRTLPADQAYISLIATATRVVTLAFYRN